MDSKLNFDNLPSSKHNKLDAISSEDHEQSSVHCTKNEKELLDHILDKIRLDRIHQQCGFEEKIIKESLQKLDQRIRDRKKKRD